MFRGTRQIEAVIERMKPLALWLQTFRPDCRVMTLSRRDFETLRSYPERALVLFEITPATDGKLYWRSFELRPEPLPSPIKPPMRP